jgi:hypothetical protein
MLYHVALFAHITGALMYFVGVGLEVIVLRNLRRAQTVEQVRVWLQTGKGTIRLFRLSTALILVAGVYMTLTVWGVWTPWIDVALIALIVFNALGPLVNGRRFRAIGQAMGALGSVAPGGEITSDLKRRIYDPTLRTSIHIMAAAALGIVFLMTVKPDLVGSLATMAAAVAVGWLSTLMPDERQGAHVEVPASVRV